MKILDAHGAAALSFTLALGLGACSDAPTTVPHVEAADVASPQADTHTLADATTDTSTPDSGGDVDAASGDTTAGDDADGHAHDTSDAASPGGVERCDDMVALFEVAPLRAETQTCALTDGSSTTCCALTFASDTQEDGPYCPPSVTSPPPYGLSVYDGATNPGLRAFNGTYLQDIAADGYAPMTDDAGNTNIATGLSGGATTGSNCLAMAQDMDLEISVWIPLTPTEAASPTAIGEVENLGVSIYGVPATGDPPSAVNGPARGPGGPGSPGGASDAINVPSIGACGAHPDPAGYLHDHFIPQVMNRVLAANGIDADEVACTRYEQRTTGLYGFAKDGYPIYASRDEASALPSDLDACSGHFGATAEYPDGVYHYHADEARAPNYPRCLRGVAVSRSFTYR